MGRVGGVGKGGKSSGQREKEWERGKGGKGAEGKVGREEDGKGRKGQKRGKGGRMERASFEMRGAGDARGEHVAGRKEAMRMPHVRQLPCNVYIKSQASPIQLHTTSLET